MSRATLRARPSYTTAPGIGVLAASTSAAAWPDCAPVASASPRNLRSDREVSKAPSGCRLSPPYLGTIHSQNGIRSQPCPFFLAQKKRSFDRPPILVFQAFPGRRVRHRQARRSPRLRRQVLRNRCWAPHGLRCGVRCSSPLCFYSADLQRRSPRWSCHASTARLPRFLSCGAR